MCSYNNIEINYKSRELIATDDRGMVTIVNTYNKSQSHIKVCGNSLIFAQMIKLAYGCEHLIAISGEEIFVS